MIPSRHTVLTLTLCAALAACHSPALHLPDPDGQIPSQQDGALFPSTLTLEYEPAGAIANSGIQLPTISPDGRHIAFMRLATHRAAAPDVLATAQGVGWLSMYLQSLDNPKSKPRAIANQGACWPTWSNDSQQLLHVLYSLTGQCGLQLYNIQSRQASTISTPWTHITSPRFSPSARFAVAAVKHNASDPSHLAIIDLANIDAPLDIPPDPNDHFATAPMWIDAYHILYFAGRDDHIELRLWSIDQPKTRRIATVNIQPPTPQAIRHALASITHPLSPDKQNLAYYDAQNDQLAVVHLPIGSQAATFPAARAATWWNATALALAYPNGIRFSSLNDSQAPTLFTGKALPLHADPATQQLLLALPSTTQQYLQLLRVHLGL